ncbi:DUF1643 domain-containing protein [Paraburkholderia sp. UCT70]|uniref:DUF1643 domain-containing protein n=1 Tax=Paraburkholderia sp. UCT70 TaxID=2991068 RepID=UPI003D198AE6
MFLMLNPSAPNASCDDPTIRRCRSRTSQGRKRQHATHYRRSTFLDSGRSQPI